MEWYHWVLAIVGLAVGIIAFWFLTYYLIAPAIIYAFNLDMEVLPVTLIIFFGGDSGIFALAIWGKRRA
ncbi:MAG: hypothetical protein EAX96_06015 [Candidatus Lokiarchaeota archaeon]|nr:hypothetical protein [Candidatus Lokiarchaeota archaeon]